MQKEISPDFTTCGSLLEALTMIGGQIKGYDEIYVIGGAHIFNECLTRFMYLCKKIYITKFKMNYKCDTFFDYDSVKDMEMSGDPTNNRDYVRYTFVPKISHGEQTYLDLLRDVYKNGEIRQDRTNVGTRSVFDRNISFDISKTIPIITTKAVNYENIIKEMLMFINGKTDSKILEDQKVKIWQPNTSKEFIEKRGLNYREGDMGPLYGFQMRHWNAPYKGCDEDYEGQGIDQLFNLIENIKSDPFSRRHFISHWNVGQLNEMVLPPCHVSHQYYVSSDRQHLSCKVTCRSSDLFLGLPYNITYYALLTYVIAHLCGLKPKSLHVSIGDAHIYANHMDAVERQLSRTPKPFPTFTFIDAYKIQSIEQFRLPLFHISGYESWPFIKGDMAA